jgi:DNA-binding NarL/FixJ family response regulator
MTMQSEPEQRRETTFCVDVRDVTLRRALSYVGASVGWNEMSAADHASAVVHDTPPTASAASNGTPDPIRILVVEPTPRAAAMAIDAIIAGHIRGVFTADRPDDLSETLTSALQGRTVIPTTLVQLGRTMPCLSERQVRIIEAVIDGKSNSQIASELFLSAASIKRELGELFKLFDITNRASLARCGNELGITSRRRPPG